MEKDEIISAINRARKGVAQYLAIMDMFPVVDVSVDRAFQRQFNFFYRIRQRPESWYSEYYRLMENRKSVPMHFEEVLVHLFNVLGRYEPSFSSKLAATLDPNEPVWDKYVIQNTGQKAPYYASQNKIVKAKKVFKYIREWYNLKLQSPDGKMMVAIFNDMIEEHDRITNIKKIDFILWQTREWRREHT